MQQMRTHFCRLNGLARPDVDGDGLGLVLKVPEVTLHELLHLRHVHFLKFSKHKAEIRQKLKNNLPSPSTLAFAC